jgi:plastocyanin
VHRWWVFLHIAGAFGFLMAHGVSVYVTLRLPKERDPARVSQLLELSASSVGFMWNSIGVLLIGGIAAGFTGHFWGQGWIWAAIVLLVVVMAAMYAMGTTWAKRLRTISGAMVGGTEAVSRSQFEEILRSKRPYTIAMLGFGGVQECSPAQGANVTVCAFDDQRFVPDRIVASSGEPFALAFANEDAGVQHNVFILAPGQNDPDELFSGEVFPGPKTVVYDVPALDPGTYELRCVVHIAMTGSLEVG